VGNKHCTTDALGGLVKPILLTAIWAGNGWKRKKTMGRELERGFEMAVVKTPGARRDVVSFVKSEGVRGSDSSQGKKTNGGAPRANRRIATRTIKEVGLFCERLAVSEAAGEGKKAQHTLGLGKLASETPIQKTRKAKRSCVE